ncbi:MAG: citrate lyase holo-[Clostridia bacterium]|nr:citrate lyase holo-[acyl-carrier protein] synthase [Clostridia bacterium]
MNINETYGKELPLGQLLSCREERVAKQQALFDEYSLPIICLTLNIAGPVKRYALADKAFGIAFDYVQNALSDGGFIVRHSEKAERGSGFEGYFVIDADALEVKRLTSEIEESKAHFRLLDIDVIKPDGNKVSRSEIGKSERKCLVCDNSAAACGRSRAHGLDVIIDKTHQLLRDMVYDYRAHKIADKAVAALLDEVYTTPKPGLVDLANCGAHSDMDVALFEKSARSLSSYFHKMCIAGQMSEDCFDALSSLRGIGKEAEKTMFEATHGINTHKGAIFSAGIMAYCAGFLLGQNEALSAEGLHEVCRKVCVNVLDDFA